jgi:hypothetical protein
MTNEKTFYIFIHETGGSMYEATSPQYYFGPYTKEEAEKNSSILESKFEEYRQEYYQIQIFNTKSPHIEGSIEDFINLMKDESE